MYCHFLSMKSLGLLRVSVEEEEKGLDISHHGGPSYAMDSNSMLAQMDSGVSRTSLRTIDIDGSASSTIPSTVAHTQPEKYEGKSRDSDALSSSGGIVTFGT